MKRNIVLFVSPSRTKFWLFLLVASLCLPAQAQWPPEQPPLPARSAAPGLGPGVEVFPNDVAAWKLSETGGSLEIVPVEGQTFRQAVRVTTRGKPQNPGTVQIAALSSRGDLRAGDAVLVTLFLRAGPVPAAGSSAPGPAQTPGRAEPLPPGHTAAPTGATPQRPNVSQAEFLIENVLQPRYVHPMRLSADPTWRTFVFPMRVVDTMAAGQARIAFRLGYADQTIEIGGVSLRNFGPVRLFDLPYRMPGSDKPRVRRAPPRAGRNLPFMAPARPAVAQRAQVSLNGTWRFLVPGQPASEIPVPEFWDARPGFDTSRGVYEKTVLVPQDWRGKKIKLEFEGVNFVTQAFVNGQPVGRHVGGFVPFAFDVTRFVRPGSGFLLRVEVQGGDLPPILGGDNRPVWPTGWLGTFGRWGILHPVWLRAYGSVHIADAFVQTSYRNKTLSVDYTLTNADSAARTVTLDAVAASAGSAKQARRAPTSQKRLRSAPLRLAPGETRVVRLTAPWPDARLWMPDDPHLYVLTSRLRVAAGTETLDEEKRRFGFREIWVAGNQFMLNGVRANLWGTSFVAHGQNYDKERYDLMSPQKWQSTVDAFLAMNIRVLRFHQSPPPDWVLDVCDERGLLVINESALYGFFDVQGNDKFAYIANAKRWIEPWIKGARNHPSIILWSAENEMGGFWIGWFKPSESLVMGDTIRRYDPTRPVTYDGDGDVGDRLINLHYPQEAEAQPKGSIYGMAHRLHPSKPTGVGEFLTSYGPHEQQNLWWQGLWVRGLRYSNFSDIRPYTLNWALNEPQSPRARSLRNSLSPVALFDKEYDGLGVAPLMNNAYPEVGAGSTLRRTLVLYNDEFRDTSVTVEVQIKAGNKTLATGRQTYHVALGEHRDIACSFPVPAASDAQFDLVLRAFKGGVQKFEESKRFKITGAGPSATSTVVTLEAPNSR